MKSFCLLLIPLLISCSDLQPQTPNSLAEDSTGVPEPIANEPISEEPPIERARCQSEEILKSWPETQNNPVVSSALLNLSGVTRDNRVLQEIEKGMSISLMNEVSAIEINNGGIQITYCVMNDYLSLLEGTEKFRFPLGMTAIADLVSNSAWALPTVRMVDQIYEQRQIGLPPRTITPGPEMTTTRTLLDHSLTINGQLQNRPGLVAGHKKDVVISERLASRPTKIAIYGWHRLNGEPIQPLSTVHHKDYADYSHGVRLVYKTVWVNGTATPIDQVLSDRTLAPLLSHEGVLSASLIRRYYR